jgi:hypothetical protein
MAYSDTSNALAQDAINHVRTRHAGGGARGRGGRHCCRLRPLTLQGRPQTICRHWYFLSHVHASTRALIGLSSAEPSVDVLSHHTELLAV